ncbi:hypothetical protein [Escherichia coli]|uniref:hypothetical protein n=1 Tax=Escherichia coli TaxID=562 RepID=UPI001F0FCDAD|nr:hypothetical protein [Escherichia coli]
MIFTGCIHLGGGSSSGGGAAGSADYHTCREAVISALVKSRCRTIPGTTCELVYSDIPVL